MKLTRIEEFEFDHPSGRFKGFVEGEEHGLLNVRLTSPANCNLKLKAGAYRPGENRFIRSSTPATATGKTRLVSHVNHIENANR